MRARPCEADPELCWQALLLDQMDVLMFIVYVLQKRAGREQSLGTETVGFLPLSLR